MLVLKYRDMKSAQIRLIGCVLAGLAFYFLAWLFIHQTNRFTIINSAEAEEIYRVEWFEITMYNPVEAQTDADPDITASGRKVSEVTAACPSRMKFGTMVEVNGKMWRCDDRMAKRYRTGNFIDLLVFDEKEARQFGRQTLEIKIYENR